MVVQHEVGIQKNIFSYNLIMSIFEIELQPPNPKSHALCIVLRFELVRFVGHTKTFLFLKNLKLFLQHWYLV